MIHSNLSFKMKWYLDGQILASEASRLQIGAANCNQRGGVAQSNVSPLILGKFRNGIRLFIANRASH